MELNDKLAFVLGSGQGCGREAALQLAAAGAFVAGFDFSPMHADQTTQAIIAQGGRAKSYGGDVVKKIAFQTTINDITDDWGEERIDVLVSAVDVAPNAHLLRLDEWDWHRALDSNLTLPFLAAQVVGRIMQAQGGGVMIFLGQMPDRPNSVVYQAGKQGLVGLVRNAMQALAPSHIRVHLLWLDDATAPPDAISIAQAAERIGNPPAQDCGSLVRWLASPAAEPLGSAILKP